MKKSISIVFKIFAILATSTGLLIAGLFFHQEEEILFQSMESKTIDHGPVYNKVKFIRSKGRDIWMMNQSHHGFVSDKWDRLAIVIESKAGKREATFLQLPSGKLEWSEELLKERINNRVSCFMCHSNGPRAIRIQDSEARPLSLREKANIILWNLRIKSYGQVKESPIHKMNDHYLEVPFRHRGKRDNEILKVGACIQCHSNEGFLARGYLTRQNSMTIDFMIKHDFMPPAGFSISDEEKKQIRDFIEGF
jgi:hypothetical protein